MNSIQRRVLRAFVQGGGDLAEGAEVDRLVRYLETRLALLPCKLRLALEVGWEQEGELDYAVVARLVTAREGETVSVEAVRQRVSRGTRALEQEIRARTWAGSGSGSRGA